MLIKLVFLVPALALSACLWGSDSRVGQLPLLGYAAQESPPALWPVLGVPGAATLGEPVVLPKGTTRLRLAPGQQYSIVELGRGALAVLPLGGEDNRALARIAGAIAAPESVWFSPSGLSAVLISKASGRMQVVGGFPFAPRVIRDIDIQTLPDVPDSAAVSDSGTSLLYSTSSAVYLLRADGASDLALGVARRASIAFLPSGDAAVGDPATGALWLVGALGSGHAAPQQIASLPVLKDIIATGDGHFLYAPDPYSPRIWSINLSTGVVVESPLQVIAQ